MSLQQDKDAPGDEETPDPPVEETASTPSETTFAAVQTGEDVPSYAGGMHYDPNTNTAYVTGATYENENRDPTKMSQCQFISFALPKLEVREQTIFGTDGAPTACSSISRMQVDNVPHLLMVGSTEKGGLLDYVLSSSKFRQYGLILDLVEGKSKHEYVGGGVIHEKDVQYPVSVVATDQFVSVVSMASRSDAETPEYKKADEKKYPNFTTGGIKKYGDDYEILIERRSFVSNVNQTSKSSAKTMELDWRKPFETADKQSVSVTGMTTIENDKRIVIVGNTVDTKGSDMNGIMVKINTVDGAFVTDANKRSVAYFSSDTDENDWIMNVCHDPKVQNEFWIVGATGGQMDKSVTKPEGDKTVHAVVSKINAATLDAVWTTQYEVTHASGSKTEHAASVALGCSVFSGTDHMYVAGNVENGAVLEGADSSAGGDDIFVAMLNKKTGEKIWTQQVGSNGDDRLARGNGIAVDTSGNAIVYGDTTGDFHRENNSSKSFFNWLSPSPPRSDLFLMTFNKEKGAHRTPLSDQSTGSEQISKYHDSEFTVMNLPMKFSTAFLIFGSVLVIVFLIVLLFRRLRRQKKKKKSVLKAMNANVFEYLKDFEVDDVDLRRSPVGGWHGTYRNLLAKGIFRHSKKTYIDDPDVDILDDDKENEIQFQNSNSKRSLNSSITNLSLIEDDDDDLPLGRDGLYKEDRDSLERRPSKRNGSKCNVTFV